MYQQLRTRQQQRTVSRPSPTAVRSVVAYPAGVSRPALGSAAVLVCFSAAAAARSVSGTGVKLSKRGRLFLMV